MKNNLLDRAIKLGYKSKNIDYLGYKSKNIDYDEELYLIKYFLEKKYKFYCNVFVDYEKYFNNETKDLKKDFKYSVETRLNLILQWTSEYNKFDSYIKALEWGLEIGLSSEGV